LDGNLKATSYFPIPFSNQLSTAYGVVEGVYQGHRYKQESGEVVTIFTFGVEKYIGFKVNEILNRNEFSISSSGGVWNGVTYDIPGSPRFEKGEKVILLIVKGKKDFHLQNLSAGKYTLIREEGSWYLRSSVFPNHGKMGKIRYEDFENMAKKKFDMAFTSFKESPKYYTKNNYEYTALKNSNDKKDPIRGPASVDSDVLENKSSRFFWPFILCLVVGFYSIFVVRKYN